MSIYSMCRMPSLLSQINEACVEHAVAVPKYCYGREENMQLTKWTNHVFFNVIHACRDKSASINIIIIICTYIHVFLVVCA